MLNAVQAVEEYDNSERLIQVETHRAARVEIRIEDSGSGIDPAIMSQIFEPLFSTRTMGIGLGLPLAKVILEEHGGGIAIENPEAGGTRVILWLPSRT